jgi:AraC-like DNA-binding protein
MTGGCDLLLGSNDLIEGGDQRIADIFERILKEGECQDEFYRKLCKEQLTQLLLHYLRQDHSHEGRVQDVSLTSELSGDLVVEQATQYIQQNNVKECSLVQIAQSVGRSERHIHQPFKDTVGISTRQYLHRYRIQKVQELIVYSNYGSKRLRRRWGLRACTTLHVPYTKLAERRRADGAQSITPTSAKTSTSNLILGETTHVSEAHW